MTSDTSPRLIAKRANERLKLAATLANNLAVGTLVGGILGPTLSGRPEGVPLVLILFVVAAILHFYGRLLLGDLQSED